MKKIKIIYIAGYGRSGSTILDLILSSNTHVIGLGEITNLFESEFRGNLSPYWKSASSQILSSLKMNVEEARFISRQGDKGNLRDKDFSKYKLLWDAIFLKLFEDINKDIWIVDSSKTTNKSYNRAKLLKKMGCHVSVIHLIRNPFEVIKSAKKGSNRLLEKGEKPAIGYFVGFKTFISWVQTNARVKMIYREKNDYEKIVITYKSLRENFFSTMNAIGDFLNLEYNPDAILSTNLKQHNDYGVSGNRLRRKKTVEVGFKANKLSFLEKKLGHFFTRILS